uniref:Uncharacterized protein n=1 Tax=Arundo donax TaxID=35708 RepID=A0A0A9RF80_ARUDO
MHYGNNSDERYPHTRYLGFEDGRLPMPVPKEQPPAHDRFGPRRVRSPSGGDQAAKRGRHGRGVGGQVWRFEVSGPSHGACVQDWRGHNQRSVSSGQRRSSSCPLAPATTIPRVKAQGSRMVQGSRQCSVQSLSEIEEQVMGSFQPKDVDLMLEEAIQSRSTGVDQSLEEYSASLKT